MNVNPLSFFSGTLLLEGVKDHFLDGVNLLLIYEADPMKSANGNTNPLLNEVEVIFLKGLFCDWVMEQIL